MTNTKDLAHERARIAEICEGNSEQYRYFVEQYHRGLIRHLYHIVKDEDAAEDIAQEAFIIAYEKIAQYNADYAFSTWLYKIADNLAFRFLKRERRLVHSDSIEEEIVDTSFKQAHLLDNERTYAVVRQAIENLPQDYSRVIKMYYWDGQDYEAIANILDRPIGTVRTWLHRAKKKLREELYGKI